METPFKLLITNKRTGEETTLEGVFPEKEWNTILRYVSFAEGIRSTLFVQQELKAGSLNWNRELGFSVEEVPSDSAVRELLHVLRPVILEKEPTYFLKVLKIFERRFDHPAPRRTFKRLRDSFRTKESQQLYTVSANELVLNSDEALKLWLNAFEYHRDPEKEVHLQSALGGMSLEAAKVIFIDALIVKANCALALADFVRSVENAPTARRARGEEV